jgi:Glyoxalase-like domain
MLDSFGITVDCAEAEIDVLADFWAAALGYEKLLPFLLVDPGGVRPRLFFQAVPEPKVGKNRWHLDLYVEHVDGLAAEVERLRALGASEVRHVDEEVMGFTNTFTAMQDPCGNEFCVCAPHVPVAASAD